MNRYFWVLGSASALIFCVATLAIATPSSTTAPHTLSPGQLAIDGYWRGDRRPVQTGSALDVSGGKIDKDAPPLGPGGIPSVILTAALPHLQPWAKAYRDKNLEAENTGTQLRTPGNRCLPYAIPGAGVPGGPAYLIGILLEPAQATFLYQENRQVRFAYFGKDHPAQLAPSWLGHSVARWDGDTLVVDTVGFNDKNLLGDTIPISNRLHIVQRLSVVDGVLEDRATFSDPKSFTETFEVVHRFVRSEPFQEYVCAENNNEGGVPTATGAPSAPDGLMKDFLGGQ